MKTLHLIRHGKSSWDLPGIPDIDRPLIERGIFNNYLMAERLKPRYTIPELVYCSPANRALHTAVIFSTVLGVSFTNIIINKNIYESSVSSLLGIIEDCKPGINNLVIIGHNPVFTELANVFLSEKIDNIPTSGVVTLQFDIKDWKISNKTPVRSDIDFPKKE